jgi:hypothetical protein
MWTMLVARRGNKRVILWGNVCRVSLIVTCAAVALTTAVYLAFAQRWNPDAPLRGLLGGLGISLVLLVVNLLTPMRRLPYLPPKG